jgi:hypothetical protein
VILDPCQEGLGDFDRRHLTVPVESPQLDGGQEMVFRISH